MNYGNAFKVMVNLLLAGIPLRSLKLAMTQAAFESAGFTSHLGVSCNNWSGLRPGKWELGSIGETDSNFAIFKSTYDWAVAFKHILFYGNATNAKTVNGYVNELINQGYLISKDYADNRYVSGMNFYYPKVSVFLQKIGIFSITGIFIIFAFLKLKK